PLNGSALAANSKLTRFAVLPGYSRPARCVCARSEVEIPEAASCDKLEAEGRPSLLVLTVPGRLDVGGSIERNKAAIVSPLLPLIGIADRSLLFAGKRNNCLQLDCFMRRAGVSPHVVGTPRTVCGCLGGRRQRHVRAVLTEAKSKPIVL